MCFDFEKAEIHLEHDDAPIALWNEFHMRRTRLSLTPEAIVDELSRELVEHFLAPSKRGPVVSSKLSSERWSKLLLLHWIHGCDGLTGYYDGGLKLASKIFFAERLSKLIEEEKKRVEEEKRRVEEMEERERLRLEEEERRRREKEEAREAREEEKAREKREANEVKEREEEEVEEEEVEEEEVEEEEMEENSMIGTGRSNLSSHSSRGGGYGSKISDIVKGNETNGWAYLEDDENGEGKTEEYVEEETDEKGNVLGIATPRE